MRKWLATGFASIFIIIAITLAGLSIIHFIDAFRYDEIIPGLIKSINDAFIALATFELGSGIAREYKLENNESNLFFAIRRTVARFVSVVIIALVLEGLLLVIKYSQLELAGNLYYPVAVITAASILLIALSIFLTLTRKDTILPPSLQALD